MFFYRHTLKSTGEAWLCCVDWYPSIAQCRQRLIDWNKGSEFLREEVPLSCVKKLFPSVEWFAGESCTWPKLNNPASK